MRRGRSHQSGIRVNSAGVPTGKPPGGSQDEPMDHYVSGIGLWFCLVPTLVQPELGRVKGVQSVIIWFRFWREDPGRFWDSIWHWRRVMLVHWMQEHTDQLEESGLGLDLVGVTFNLWWPSGFPQKTFHTRWSGSRPAIHRESELKTFESWK